MSKFEYPIREIDLSELFKYLMKNLAWIILGTGLIGAAFMALQTSREVIEEPKSNLYTASSMIYVKNNLENMPEQEGVAMDYTGIMISNDVVQSVIETCDLEMQYKEFISKLRLYNHGVGYQVISIDFNYYKKKDAKKIVDIYTDKCIEKLKSVTGNNNISIIDKAYVYEQMSASEEASLGTGIRPAEGEQILESNIGKYIVIGAFIGFVLMSGIYVLIYIFDSSIKNKTETERYLQVPVIGEIMDETRKQGVSRCFFRYKRRFHY
ncbi:Wzz/FepE/Etk N-terminal domain-containing protein [Anaerosacchariphilus polymeriproducens]|uniref:Polysaccharide chain length determinant N-terminal domain-containing protein n=1 Tax=Anaerosacchariphilus polymeriproducens TaxID=1812858 RepID=A0A371ARA8_9FIRM|nr:Wzz/FepE/Etk N-terminal domain-containing protein [Anaerosacchariphilus polymeriproducens]RDU22103.1 hypothetical protein DWV06_16370 [Anaerosacchariphilus polymeriproducens]